MNTTFIQKGCIKLIKSDSSFTLQYTGAFSIRKMQSWWAKETFFQKH